MTRLATLITGASAGLGAEFARQCARRGETLVLVARRKDRLDALAEEIRAKEMGVTVHVIAADLSTPDAPQKLISDIEALGIGVDTLINNAGFGLIGQFAGLSGDRQLQMIDLNIRTLTALTHLVLPAMIARKGGAILNVASTAAFQAGPGFGVYFATKAYVLSFTEALHQELKGKGIRVSALCPGPTRTEFGEVAGLGGGGFDRFAADAQSVVAAGLKGMDTNKAVIIPGLINKISAQSGRIIPRALMRRIVASIKL